VDPCDQVWALTLDVPAADLRPVEARLDLTRIAPMTYDLPFQGNHRPMPSRRPP
jgi:hypothetical protein